jgi:glycosyltransferase involved in cell wall biosynthesis
MWPETLSATGMMESSFIANALAGLAKIIYRRADAISVISPGFKRNLIEKGVPGEKIRVIPNWADEDVFQLAPADQAVKTRFGMQHNFNVIFAGNMGLAQSLDIVLDAAALLQTQSDIQFLLIGDGVDKARLQQLAVDRNLTNVRFYPQQSIQDMPSIYACADALIVHLRRDPLFSITIPSKTIAYLASGRPVVCALEGDGADVVRAAGAGIICNPEDSKALAESVLQLYDMPREQREQLGQAGRAHYLSHYTRRILVDQYCDLFGKIVDQRRNGKQQNALIERT